MHPVFLRTSVLAGALAASGMARADTAEQSKKLFDQGVADMEAGKYERACPAVQQSYRLDPRPGTLFTLAECEAQRGRMATAIERYKEYLGLYRNFDFQKRAAQKDRADISAAQITALSARVPQITLKLPDGEAGVVVTRDGEVVPGPMIGLPLAVDPGEHVLTTQIEGGAPVERRVTVQAGDRRELVLTVSHEPSPERTAHRTGAIVAAAIGGAGAVLAAVNGALALEQKSIVDSECTRGKGGYECATQRGVEAGEQLKTLGATSTAGVAVALAGLSASTILLLTMPSPRSTSVRLAVNAGGVSLCGSF